MREIRFAIGRTVILAGLAFAVVGCMSTPAEDDPVQIKLNDLDVRLTRIEKVMQNQSLLEVSNQIEALRADVRSMHNDVDQLNNSMEGQRRQQRDMYADLDQRMKALEGRSGAPVAGADSVGGSQGSGGSPSVAAPASLGASAASAATPPTDTSVYQAAFGLLKDGQYDRAIQAFQQFLVNYPGSSLDDNAQYWMGEAHYVNRSFPEAQSAFQRVIDKYPQSRKVPDALLKIGYCRYEMRLWDSARAALQQVLTQYPDEPAAKLARQRLDKMATENH